MTSDEALQLVIDGINYAAYRETDSSLHDSDKNHLFGSEHCRSGRPVAILVLGPKATSRKRWRRCLFGLTRSTVQSRLSKTHSDFLKGRSRSSVASSGVPTVDKPEKSLRVPHMIYGNRVLYKGMSRKKTLPATGGSKEIPPDIQPVY
jgi:hypothetical protein